MISGTFFFARRLANCAICSASALPSSNASRISWPETPNRSDSTLLSFTLASCRILSMRFFSPVAAPISFFRRRVRSRSSRCGRFGIKLGVIIPWRSKCASHQASLASVLCPFRAFTSCGFTNATSRAPSITLNTGFQYEPVLSMMALRALFLFYPFTESFQLSYRRAELAHFGPRFPIGRSNHHAGQQEGLSYIDTDAPLNHRWNHVRGFPFRTRSASGVYSLDLLPRAYAPIGDPCTPLRPVSFTSFRQYPVRPFFRCFPILHIFLLGGGRRSTIRDSFCIFCFPAHV